MPNRAQPLLSQLNLDLAALVQFMAGLHQAVSPIPAAGLDFIPGPGSCCHFGALPYVEHILCSRVPLAAVLTEQILGYQSACLSKAAAVIAQRSAHCLLGPGGRMLNSPGALFADVDLSGCREFFL